MSLYEGLKPATPQYAAGRITEPAVCEPVAIGTMPAATAAAEPEEEPPGVCSRLCGLRVLPVCWCANSVVTVLPRMMPPARRSMATVEASLAGGCPLWAAAPYSVRLSCTFPLSGMDPMSSTERTDQRTNGIKDYEAALDDITERGAAAIKNTKARVDQVVSDVADKGEEALQSAREVSDTLGDAILKSVRELRY